MDLTNDERVLLLRGLFELTITYAEDDELREEVRPPAIVLGGDACATLFGAHRCGRSEVTMKRRNAATE